MSNQDWFECCWDDDEVRWRDADERHQTQPRVYQYYAGSVYVPGYGEWSYEGYERDWNVMPGTEAPEGTVFIIQSTERNWVTHGSTLQEAERNLIKMIKLAMERFIKGK